MKFKRSSVKRIFLSLRKFITRNRHGFLKFDKTIHLGNEPYITIPTSNGDKIALSFCDAECEFFDFSDKKIRIIYDESATRVMGTKLVTIQILK